MRHEWATLIDKDKNRLLTDKLDLHGFKKRVLYLSGLVFVQNKRLKTYFLELASNENRQF